MLARPFLPSLATNSAKKTFNSRCLHHTTNTGLKELTEPFRRRTLTPHKHVRRGRPTTPGCRAASVPMRAAPRVDGDGTGAGEDGRGDRVLSATGGRCPRYLRGGVTCRAGERAGGALCYLWGRAGRGWSGIGRRNGGEGAGQEQEETNIRDKETGSAETPSQRLSPRI